MFSQLVGNGVGLAVVDGAGLGTFEIVGARLGGSVGIAVDDGARLGARVLVGAAVGAMLGDSKVPPLQEQHIDSAEKFQSSRSPHSEVAFS